ncbi:MAG TPA: carbon-nitrogen hydrolase family protein [Dermatophilaceae bacterium]|nr:carbon-nitrogen hydrolase family protein [Dermatophilaceae bacterium]
MTATEGTAGSQRTATERSAGSAASAGSAGTLRVAAVQLSSGPDPVANLAQAAELVARAADDGARLVVLPEAAMACFGTRLREIAEPVDGAFGTGLRELAARHTVTIVAGMFEPADDGRVHNTLLLTGPDGEATYRKIHLYDAFGSRESAVVNPGTEHVVVDACGTRIGLATCYDVRFADQFTALGRAGAQVVALPASWGDGPGKAEQWDLLVRARAMDAQAYLVAAGQAWVAGQEREPLGIGRSAVTDPLGRVVARLGHEPGVLVTTIDLGLVPDVRERVPIL